MLIRRMQVEGGFLDGLDLRFEAGLNVLIGGRGTGKSSIIELIRYCLDVRGNTNDDDAIRERTRAGLDAAAARGRKGGRPSKLSAEDLKAVRAMLADPTITVQDVARRLDVSPATLYRHLPAARSAAG